MNMASREKTDHQERTAGPCPPNPRAAALPVKGPVRILCDEIGFPWDRRLEREDVFVAFVRGLVEEVAERRHISARIAEMAKSSEPSEGSLEALGLAEAMLAAPTTAARIQASEALHDACWRLNPDEAYPTDHLIDMLSSCASAIRFGLATLGALHSRHAAAAAQHVWKQRYGVACFDSHTPAWEKEWARSVLMGAVLSLLPALVTRRATAPEGPPDVSDKAPGTNPRT